MGGEWVSCPQSAPALMSGVRNLLGSRFRGNGGMESENGGGGKRDLWRDNRPFNLNANGEPAESDVLGLE